MRTLSKSTFLKPPVVDWRAVADSVSAKLGDEYSANYCREVAKGYRNSAVVAPLLQDFGVMTRPKLVSRRRSAQDQQAQAAAA